MTLKVGDTIILVTDKDAEHRITVTEHKSKAKTVRLNMTDDEAIEFAHKHNIKIESYEPNRKSNRA
jgi:plastocyanin